MVISLYGYVCDGSYNKDKGTGEFVKATEQATFLISKDSKTLYIGVSNKMFELDFYKKDKYKNVTAYRNGNGVIVIIYNNFKDGVRIITSKEELDFTNCKD